MKRFPIATCFLEMVKKFLCIADLVFVFLFVFLSLVFFGFVSNLLALFQHLAPAIP